MWLPGYYAAATAIGCLLSIISFLWMSRQQRKQVSSQVASWFSFTPRTRDAASSSKTPPRSISPEKKVPVNVPPPCEYQNVLPPWTRDVLPKGFAKGIGTAADTGELIAQGSCQKLIPFTTDFRSSTAASSTFTPMGVSLSEVAALGDFPDYAELSGVPLPKPYTGFKIETATPRPYRPFRWAYHQTMSLMKMENDWWLELEHTYAERIAERKGLVAKYSKMVLDYLPGSELGCKEVMEMALQFLCARYPHYFWLSYSNDKGHVFHNGILHNETIIKDMHPLHVLLENVPEDFAVMIRNPDDGYYYFRAGLLCSSLGWNVSTKLGMQLKQIHEPIPDYKEKMEFSMDRYFSKMPSSRPIQRGSWGLEVDTPLFMPPGDPHEAYRDYQMDPAQLTLSRVHLRVDWQTLRRLPLSGAIIFNFKALFTPIEDFRKYALYPDPRHPNEPHIPALLHHILLNAKPAIMKYKNTWHVEHVALPALSRWKEEQEAN
ncbi:MAG: hypothetical protein Q9222_007103, partial [Ikaeria aurantiellina]